jgi:hypothetical protein
MIGIEKYTSGSCCAPEEVFKQEWQFISDCVSTECLLDDLKERNMISDFDYDKICDEGAKVCDVQESNRIMLKSLMTTLESYCDARESYFALYDFIRLNHPSVSVHIPEIQLGLRLKTMLRSDVPNNFICVSVGLFGSTVQYDIRKMQVSTSVYILFLYNFYKFIIYINFVQA